jgi:ABC-2 type transport system ATP-binding protein
LIALRNLTKLYGTTKAVDRVSLDIGKGEVVGLLGHNGAGKTTMMKMVTGFLEPTSGTVSVAGIDVQSDRVGAQQHIGYLPESAPLYPEMLVQEYLLMMAGLRGVPAAERRDAVITAVRETGLEKHVVHPIAHLSKGFRQRVGIAQAIVHRPDVLILDEPANGLDPVQNQSIRQLILNLAKHSTVILSTHILTEVEAVCDRVVVLIDGKLAADGKLDDLLKANVVRFEVETSDDVAPTVRSVPGVTGVDRQDDVGPRQVWMLTHEEGAEVVAPLVQAGVKAGWSITSAAPRQPSLHEFFQQLQAREVDRMEARR